MSAQTRIVDAEIVQAWLTAAADLGIKVTAPFTIHGPHGEVEAFEALVHEFDGPNGTVDGLVARRDPTGSRKDLGYYASNLSDSYRHYNRDLFVATLDDWKWYGTDESRPSWYTGRNWS